MLDPLLVPVCCSGGCVRWMLYCASRDTMAARWRWEAVMAEQRLTFALSDPDDRRPGGLVPEILTALAGIQDAVRPIVQHLGDREKGPGQPPKLIRDQSTLRLAETRPGSFIADLELEAPHCQWMLKTRSIRQRRSYRTVCSFGLGRETTPAEWKSRAGPLLPALRPANPKVIIRDRKLPSGQ